MSEPKPSAGHIPQEAFAAVKRCIALAATRLNQNDRTLTQARDEIKQAEELRSLSTAEDQAALAQRDTELTRAERNRTWDYVTRTFKEKLPDARYYPEYSIFEGWLVRVAEHLKELQTVDTEQDQQVRQAALREASEHFPVAERSGWRCRCGVELTSITAWKNHVAPIVEAEKAAERLPWAWPPSVPPGEQPKYPPPVVEHDGNSLTYAGFRWKRILPPMKSSGNPSPVGPK
jgi:hypothetical protein